MLTSVFSCLKFSLGISLTSDESEQILWDTFVKIPHIEKSLNLCGLFQMRLKLWHFKWVLSLYRFDPELFLSLIHSSNPEGMLMDNGKEKKKT